MLVVTPPKAVDVTKMHISPGIAEPVSFFDLPVVVACWSSPAKSVDTVELSDMESRFLQIAGSGSLILIARYCIVFGVSWLRRSLPVDGRVTLHMVSHLRGRNVRVLRGIHGEGTVRHSWGRYGAAHDCQYKHHREISISYWAHRSRRTCFDSRSRGWIKMPKDGLLSRDAVSYCFKLVTGPWFSCNKDLTREV